jgi:hypothetical protein
MESSSFSGNVSQIDGEYQDMERSRGESSLALACNECRRRKARLGDLWLLAESNMLRSKWLTLPSVHESCLYAPDASSIAVIAFMNDISRPHLLTSNNQNYSSMR